MRKLIMTALGVLLVACQTVPVQPHFSAAQVAVFEQEGFKPVGENWELGIADRVLFDVNQSELQPANAAIIVRLATVLLKVGIGGTMVEGHTDASGSSAYNQALSERRAAAVKAAMIGAGMREAAVRTVGLGETDPIDSNATEEGRAQNRRVVVVVAPGDILKR
jgi:outer membrane protein OmpA-like peptidoglycan-associated protein